VIKENSCDTNLGTTFCRPTAIQEKEITVISEESAPDTCTSFTPTTSGSSRDGATRFKDSKNKGVLGVFVLKIPHYHL